MLSKETEREGRVAVSTVTGYLDSLDKHKAALAERKLDGRDFVLHGFFKTPYTFPYPGPYGQTGPVVMLWRDQAENLVADLLKALAPGGELPTDAAELLDFVTTVLRNGSSS